MRELIERLYREQTLAPGELRTLLLECRGVSIAASEKVTAT